MPDTSKVCAFCDFYDDMSMDCERFPPRVNGVYTDENGEECTRFDQPFIQHPWTTRCGEWRAITPDPLDGPESEERKAAVERLQIIVNKLKEKDQKKENNADGNRT